MWVPFHSRLISTVLPVLLFLSIAHAQDNRVTIWTFRGHDAAISSECSNQAREFLRLAQAFPLPHDWHFILVCDDFTWRRFVRETGQYRAGVEVYGSTNLLGRITYIRGWALTHVDLTSGAPSPARIMAHELAHVILGTPDDREAEAQAIAWLRDSDLPVYPIREAP